jgi:hypothetical protein
MFVKHWSTRCSFSGALFIASDTEMIPGISADKVKMALPRGGG